MAEVILDNLKKVYDGGVIAVHESSLDIQDKEFMVLVGPSGCGKSTTLRMIAGLEEISDGVLKIGERVVNQVPPKDRDIAMVFQNYALYPHMTVYQNMAFGLKLRKFPKKEIDERVREAAKALGLEEYLERKPKALSGGQRQRVALGRAIVRQPKVFLLDEPLSNLDAKMRVSMRKELNLLHKRLQTTMIYVTHDQVEAMTLGDRICVMSHGYIQQVGKPLDVYDRPVNKFVAGFIGTPTMNFLEGELKEVNGASAFVAEGIEIPLSGKYGELVAGHLGQKASFGIRPEKVRIAKTESELEGAEKVLPGKVEVIERLGDSQLVFMEVAGQPFNAKIDSHYEITDGDDVWVDLALEYSHVFAGENDKNLTLSAKA
ncbi:MAG: sn-glycerol-3-phosphate ABC transporter ATP-binding protein UgpC [Lentisphaeria bacterium]|nr:sn-glycerol-3-phosphate ABC transporter ATP-binding protein UgpC [Lentisphaeria bacterium]